MLRTEPVGPSRICRVRAGRPLAPGVAVGAREGGRPRPHPHIQDRDRVLPARRVNPDTRARLGIERANVKQNDRPEEQDAYVWIVRPAGTVAPKSTSAAPRLLTAGSPACSTAPTFGLLRIDEMSSADAVIVTTTTGFFAAAATCWISWACASGKEMFVASCPSDAKPTPFPTTRITASAEPAMAAAAATLVALNSDVAAAQSSLPVVVFSTPSETPQCEDTALAPT